MVVTFRRPSKFPGLVLPAGTYVFRLADADSNTVEILNKDENHLYGTFVAHPDEPRAPLNPSTFATKGRPLAGSDKCRVLSWRQPHRKLPDAEDN